MLICFSHPSSSIGVGEEVIFLNILSWYILRITLISLAVCFQICLVGSRVSWSFVYAFLLWVVFCVLFLFIYFFLWLGSAIFVLCFIIARINSLSLVIPYKLLLSVDILYTCTCLFCNLPTVLANLLFF